jgi:hypothetical protein
VDPHHNLFFEDDHMNEEQRENIMLEYHMYSMNLRFAPWLNFLIQCFAIIIRLYLIIQISLVNYSTEFGTNYKYPNQQWTTIEYWLLLITTGLVIFEIGLFIDSCCNTSNIQKRKKIFSFSSFLSFIHSRKGIFLDYLSISLIVGWGIFRIFSDGINVARVLLAIDAIPQSFSLLRFLAFYKPLGELTFTLKEITKDIFVFGMFYSLIIIGFGTTIYCLYHTNGQFPTLGLMFLQLFENSLQDFDFTIFDTNSVVVDTIGILIFIAFLILITLVTINVFIARLSCIYDKVHNKATAEWSFTKSYYISRFIYLKEVHPCCMLPPPFNLLTGASAFLFYCYSTCCSKLSSSSATTSSSRTQALEDGKLTKAENIRKEREQQPIYNYPISVAGTVANLLLSMSPFGIMIRLYPLCVVIYRRIVNRPKRFGSNQTKYTLFFWFFILPYVMFLYFLKFLFNFTLPFFYYRKHVEEIVNDENKEFVFIHLFSLNHHSNQDYSSQYRHDEDGLVPRERTTSLARSFSSSKHFQRTLSHILKNDDDEAKENEIRMHTFTSTTNPILVRKEKDDDADDDADVGDATSDDVDEVVDSSFVDPLSVLSKSNKCNDEKKPSAPVRVRSMSSIVGEENDRLILELDCYPETNHLLFNEIDIENILKPLKHYFDYREKSQMMSSDTL